MYVGVESGGMIDGDHADGERVLADGGREEPNLGDYDHEPAVDADGESPDGRNGSDADAAGGRTADAAAAANADRTRRGGGRAGGDDAGRSVDAGAARAGTAEATNGGAQQGANAGAAPVQGTASARDPFGEDEGPGVWDRVGVAVSTGDVRSTAAAVMSAYGLLSVGFVLLTVLVGGLGLPVLEASWDTTYPLVASGALLTAVPVVCLSLTLFAGVYAAVRHDGTNAAVASGVGAAVGSVLVTGPTIGAVALVAGGPTVRLDGVLIDLLFLAVVTGLVAVGTTVVAERLGLAAPVPAPAASDSAGVDGD